MFEVGGVDEVGNVKEGLKRCQVGEVLVVTERMVELQMSRTPGITSI